MRGEARLDQKEILRVELSVVPSTILIYLSQGYIRPRVSAQYPPVLHHSITVSSGSRFLTNDVIRDLHRVSVLLKKKATIAVIIVPRQ